MSDGKERPYARLSETEKVAVQLDRMREPPVACPRCGTQTTVTGLLAHVDDRCTGPREPHPQSHWVTWREALGLGVPGKTLSRWVRRGYIRTADPEPRRYLLRDLALRLAERHARRR